MFEKFIEDNLKDQWELEAEQAKIWLNEKDYESDLGDAEEVDPSTDHLVRINGHTVDVVNIYTGGHLPTVDLGGEEYIIATDAEEAGEAAMKYWWDMIENDPSEFECMVGREALIAWCLKRSYAVGSVAVNSLEAWVQLSAEYPEEQWAGYDGKQIDDMQISVGLANELGFVLDDVEGDGYVNIVAYRSN